MLNSFALCVISIIVIPLIAGWIMSLFEGDTTGFEEI